jgi:hypothetical protein
VSDHGGKPHDEQARPGEPFLDRFHRRKLAARRAALAAHDEDAPSPADGTPSGAVGDAARADLPAHRPGAEEAQGGPSDADMPPLEALTPASDYSGFLSPRVSEALRRAALRKLFHSAEFNVVDGLDEYADDFTRFEALGDLLTADMRHLLEVQARKQAEAVQRAVLDGEQMPGADETSPPAAEDPAEAAGGENPAEPGTPA